MKKILVIESGAEMRRNLTTILRLEKFQPLPAENGLVGVELAKTEKPDLILSDVVLPELDGFGVITPLRTNRDTLSIPFIFVTAKAEKCDIRIAMNLGADDYLTKPVAKLDLLDAIRSRLERALCYGVVDLAYLVDLQHLRLDVLFCRPSSTARHGFRALPGVP
jgi:DNA-binding response OmpR family regulator